MRYLDLEHVLMLHEFVLSQTGGGDGLRDIGRLEAALATQTQLVFGSELYPTVHTKAAALVRGIIADHAFVDGNKRTAMMVGLVFLEINDLTCHATNQELEDFAVRIATDNPSVEDITAWLEQHSNKEKV